MGPGRKGRLSMTETQMDITDLNMMSKAALSGISFLLRCKSSNLNF